MANTCSFEFRISGPDQITALELADSLGGLGHVYETAIADEWDDYSCITVVGSCAWSMNTAFRFMLGTSIEGEVESKLLAECARLKITLEAYSEEHDCGFEEHIIVREGVPELYEEVGAESYNVDSCDDVALDDAAYSHDMTKQELMDRADGGYVRFGGYDWCFDGVPAETNDGYKSARRGFPAVQLR